MLMLLSINNGSEKKSTYLRTPRITSDHFETNVNEDLTPESSIWQNVKPRQGWFWKKGN